MTMFSFLAYLAVALTIIAVVLSIWLVISHAWSETREKVIRAQRDQARQTLSACIHEGLSTVDTLARLRGTDTPILEGVLLQAISEGNPSEQHFLQQICRSIGLVQKELNALTNRAWTSRLKAANHLGYMGASESVQPLIDALQDEMLDVRLAAARGLARLKAIEAIGPILQNLALLATWPLQRVAEILEEFGQPAVNPLLILLDEPSLSDAARIACIRSLGMLRAHEAVHVIVGQITHPTPEVRVQSAKALGKLGDPQTVPTLKMAMVDDVWEIRSAAAQSLGQLGSEAAIPILAHGLADPVWWVRFNSAESLFAVGPQGQKILQAALNHKDDFAREISRQVLEEHGLTAFEQGVSP